MWGGFAARLYTGARICNPPLGRRLADYKYALLLLVILLAEGVRRCPPQGFVFAGRKEGTHLTTRTYHVAVPQGRRRVAEYVVARAAASSGVGIPVSSMSLRHSYAVHALQAGMNLRELQEALGHLHIETTMRYCRLLPPEDLVTPLDRMEIPPEAEPPQPPPGPTHDLFDAPLEPGPLPALDTWPDRARALYAALKTGLIWPRLFGPSNPALNGSLPGSVPPVCTGHKTALNRLVLARYTTRQVGGHGCRRDVPGAAPGSDGREARNGGDDFRSEGLSSAATKGTHRTPTTAEIVCASNNAE